MKFIAMQLTRAFSLTTCMLLGLGAIGCGPAAYKITPVPADRALEEALLIDEGGFAPAKIVLVDVDGILMNSKGFSIFSEGENPVSLFTEKLDMAAKDPSCRALIVRINSPGGSVTASDIMYRELLYFKERTDCKRPVVAVMMDVAASGGYYIACAADDIFANPTTVTGSIGVIMQMFNVHGTMNKIGVQTEAIKSGEMKDAGSPFRPLGPREREIFQDLVDNFFDRFVEVVAKGRNMEEANVREVADGRVYSAQEALQLGFVDRVGTLRDAIAEVRDRIDARRVRVVTYQRPLGWKPNIYAEQASGPPQMNLFNVTVPPNWAHPEPQFMYIWSPGL